VRGKKRTGYWLENVRVRDHLEDLGVEEDNIKTYLQEVIRVAWTGLIWLSVIIINSN
jgi:hypothetical protein